MCVINIGNPVVLKSMVQYADIAMMWVFKPLGIFVTFNRNVHYDSPFRFGPWMVGIGNIFSFQKSV